MNTVSIEPLPTRLAAALDIAPPEHRWLVDAVWAEEGVGVLGGAPETAKSWLALEMATAVAAGIPCLGRFDVRRPGPTLVYLAEDALPMVRQRIAALCQGRSSYPRLAGRGDGARTGDPLGGSSRGEVASADSCTT